MNRSRVETVALDRFGAQVRAGGCGCWIRAGRNPAVVHAVCGDDHTDVLDLLHRNATGEWLADLWGPVDRFLEADHQGELQL